MDGRTKTECEQLQAEAAADERRAEENQDDNPEYADCLRRRAAWKRHLGSGTYRVDAD